MQEWIDGVNEMLTESGILLNGTKFEKVYAFQNDNLTNLLYPFEDVELSIGKLAMWRIATHTQFYGTWLSNYVPNYLGGFIVAKQKPDCELIGQDGNIFNLMGIASRTLKQNGMAPFIPNFYALILDDSNKEERKSVCLPDFQCFGFAMRSGFSEMK